METMEPIYRSPALINHKDCFILIIDVQDFFMKSLIWKIKKKSFLNRIIHLIKISQLLKIPIIVTAENIQKNGSINELIAEILGDQSKILDKFIYSCWGQQDIQNEIKKCQRNVAVLCGLETDVCVMQTAIDLLNNNYRVVLLTDLTFSRNLNEHKMGLKRMEYHGAILSLLKTWQEEITAGIRTDINYLIKFNKLDNI